MTKKKVHSQHTKAEYFWKKRWSIWKAVEEYRQCQCGIDINEELTEDKEPAVSLVFQAWFCFFSYYFGYLSFILKYKVCHSILHGK